MTVFELGRITISNSEPSLLESDMDQQILTSLNTVTLTLQKMCAYTVQPSVPPHALIGNISIEATMIVGHQLGIRIHISKPAVTVNEQQLSFFLRTLNGNLHEKSLCEEDLKWIQETLTQYRSTRASSRTLKIKNDISHFCIRIDFKLLPCVAPAI